MKPASRLRLIIGGPLVALGFRVIYGPYSPKVSITVDGVEVNREAEE